MKYYFLILMFCLNGITTLYGDNGKTTEAYTSDSFYLAAFTEISEMLDGKRPIDLKRAVFLTEWAYLRGGLDYQDFCRQIDLYVAGIRKFINANGFDLYKTGANAGLFEFYARHYSMNRYTPFTYDFEDFGGEKDLTKLFVSKVMLTHSGQCRGLPMLYKVLAEELGAEACIAFAPQHLFIRHRDEEGRWVNFETTIPGISKDEFYIKSFGIGAEAIRNKLYLHGLTTKETVAYLLSEMLAVGHMRLFGEDRFMLKCAEKTLEHFPGCIQAKLIVDDFLREESIQHQEKYGVDSLAMVKYNRWKEARAGIMASGYEEMPEEIYMKLMEQAREQAALKGVDIDNN